MHTRFSGAFILLSGVSEISCGVQNVPGEKGTCLSIPEAESGWRGLISLKAKSKRKRTQRLKNPLSSLARREPASIELTVASIIFPFFSILPGFGGKVRDGIKCQNGAWNQDLYFKSFPGLGCCGVFILTHYKQVASFFIQCWWCKYRDSKRIFPHRSHFELNTVRFCVISPYVFLI